MGWMHRFDRVARAVVTGLTMIVALAACGSTLPVPDPSRALLVENRSSTAVVLDISDQGGVGQSASSVAAADYEAIVPPCGGQVTVYRGGDGMPRSDDWLIFLLVDPSKVLDQTIATTGVDPAGLTGMQLSIAWSTGEIDPSDLPKTISVTPSGVTVNAVGDANRPTVPCQPWAGATATIR